YLMSLTQHNDKDVRARAYYSLGKAAVLNAIDTKSGREMLSELEKAIEFYENSLQERRDNNPSVFCQPFYRSIYKILKDSGVEYRQIIQEYIESVHVVIKKYYGRDQIVAMENLSFALEELQKIQGLSMECIRLNLRYDRDYCDMAAEPFASSDWYNPVSAMRIAEGLPIINLDTKKKIEDAGKNIQQMSSSPCCTLYQANAAEIYGIGQRIANAEKLEEVRKGLTDIQPILKSLCSAMPKEEKISLSEMLRILKNENSVNKQIELINEIIIAMARAS
ncbi:MAG TPA: hypothetical protein VHT96_14905, partial [Clostridia bacterium]|nr:hypothetical protein [Clostridia bacterium]